jgi:1,4-dihydroxy-2-naphthoate octaprenyltransferase
VLVGTAFGFERAGAIDMVAAFLVLAAAVLVQVATNMQNDVGYTVRRAERGTRTGLPRATANGWLSVREVRVGILLIGIVAFGVGLALAAYRGWPVLVIGAASLTAALAYMGGPKPIAYTPFGELTVFAFFGLVAVTGTQWVLTGSFGLVTFLASMAIGGLAAAALAVNNHRDMEHDRLVGRRTFAVVFGAAGSRGLYRALLLGPFFIVCAMAACAEAPTLLLPLLLVPIALQLLRDFERCPPGIAFNQILFQTFRLELWFAILLSVGALLVRMPN